MVMILKDLSTAMKKTMTLLFSTSEELWNQQKRLDIKPELPGVIIIWAN